MPIDKIRHDRKQAVALVIDAFTNGPAQFTVGPVADARFRVGRNVTNTKNARKITLPLGDPYADGGGLSCHALTPRAERRLRRPAINRPVPFRMTVVTQQDMLDEVGTAHQQLRCNGDLQIRGGSLAGQHEPDQRNNHAKHNQAGHNRQPDPFFH